jgi:hypothetical protein
VWHLLDGLARDAALPSWRRVAACRIALFRDREVLIIHHAAQQEEDRVSSENPYAPPRAAVADVTRHEPAPDLWNPDAAARWSLVFSPVFGSILHMKNWKAMGDERRATSSRSWAIASAAFLAVVLLLGVALPQSKVIDALGRIGGLGLLIAWYYAIGKSQSAAVLARYGKSYPRKGWLKPLGIAVVLLVVSIVVVGLVGLSLGALTTGG